MIQKIRWFLNLNAFEKRRFFSTIFLLPITEIHLRYNSFKQTHKWLEQAANRGLKQRNEDVNNKNQAIRLAEIVKAGVQVSPIKGTCLSQSLVLWHILKYCGIQGDLNIGVMNPNQWMDITARDFVAHAWVEYQGNILNDRPDVNDRFVVIHSSNQTSSNVTRQRLE